MQMLVVVTSEQETEHSIEALDVSRGAAQVTPKKTRRKISFSKKVELAEKAFREETKEEGHFQLTRDGLQILRTKGTLETRLLSSLGELAMFERAKQTFGVLCAKSRK